MAKSETLASGFIDELLAASLQSRNVFEIVRQYIKFSYFQTEAEKTLWRWLTERFDKTGLIPSIRQAQQHFDFNSFWYD